MFPARTARLSKERFMAFSSAYRSWLLAAFAATNMGACMALSGADAGFGGDGGTGAVGWAGNGGAGGSIDYDAGSGGTTPGDYAALCGPGACDVAAKVAVSSCATGGGGAGGSTASGGAGGSTDTGTGGAGGSTAGEIECKLAFDADGVSRACTPSGSTPEDAPCTTASDCGPGLGCVLLGDQATGVCRAYCCGDTELCRTGTYCAPRPMAEAADPDVVIPVCIDADDCTLLATAQCPEGTGCFVVRGDGTTSCIPPGPGKQGDSCPCAEGYACTKLDEVCFKVCHTNPSSQTAECDAGYTCQGNVATLPDGFGLCISTNGVH